MGQQRVLRRILVRIGSAWLRKPPETRIESCGPSAYRHFADPPVCCTENFPPETKYRTSSCHYFVNNRCERVALFFLGVVSDRIRCAIKETRWNAEHLFLLRLELPRSRWLARRMGTARLLRQRWSIT